MRPILNPSLSVAVFHLNFRKGVKEEIGAVKCPPRSSLEPAAEAHLLTNTGRPGAVGRCSAGVPRGHGGGAAAHGTRHGAEEHSGG